MNSSDDTLAYWFIFFNNQLLLQKKDKQDTIPVREDSPVPVSVRHQVGTLNGLPCVAAAVDVPLEETDELIPIDLRASFDYLERPLYDMAGKASQILYWDKHSRFCPVCGTETVQTTAISKQCPACQNEMFPAVSAAVLVLIRKGDTILLVHAHNFKGTFNSLVAGFLETGETLEQCVEREVREETGLQVKNITYFGNQPWPYPSNLMVGFIADYAGGMLCLQEEELSSGDFYTKDNLPNLPRKLSLARKMIDWWLEHPAQE